MSDKPIRILLIEDNPGDIRLIQEYLAEIKDASYGLEIAGRLSAGLDYLATKEVDIILLDLGLPDSQGLDTLYKVYPLASGAPVVVLTGLSDEHTAIETVRHGAQDYLLKGEINSRALWRVIRYAIERNQTRKTLRESEEKYRTLVEQARDAICIIQDRLVKFANSRLGEMWGGSTEEIVNTPFVNYVHPDNLAMVADLYYRRMAGEQVPTIYEAALMRKDGSKLYAELNVGVITYLGKPAELVIIRDITERKKMEQELRENEMRLQEAQRLGKIGNWEFDINTQKIQWSDEVYQLYERDRTLGPPTAEEEALYYSPEQARELREYARIVTKTKREIKYDVTAKLPSGKTAFFSCAMCPVTNDKGQVIKLFGIVQDITERRQTEEELKRSEERFNTIFRSAPVGIAYSDSEGKFLQYNQRFHEILGYNKEELLGKSFKDISHPDDLEESVALVKEIREGKRSSFTLEKRYYTKDGRTIWGNVAVFGLRNERGELQNHIATLVDITERKKTEQQLRESEERNRAILELGERTGEAVVMLQDDDRGAGMHVFASDV